MLDHIFVHIPGTAGIAIRSVVGSRRIVHDLARNHYQRPGVTWGQYYIYAFFRNAYDRAVSLCAKTLECYNGKRLTPEMFRAWVAAGMPDTRVARHAASPRVCTPQVDYIRDENGELLVDFLGMYELLGRDVVTVCQRLEVPLPASPVPRMNSSNRLRPYRPYYDRDTREIVAATYAADLAVIRTPQGSVWKYTF
jgi:hypothetical protein